MKKRNGIVEISFEFALMIIEFAELLEERRKYIIARQLLKSGSSIGANVREAQSCESKLDFIHKLKISHKEAEETEYWLWLCEKAPPEMASLLSTTQKLLSRIISTTRSNLKTS